MKTVFPFSKIKNEYIYSIFPNIILHIKTITHSFTILYFTDELNNIIDVPNDILVYSYIRGNKNKKYIEYPTEKNTYVLSSTDNYDIKYNGYNVLHIKSKISWDIITGDF
jgi:hypothetical protein